MYFLITTHRQNFIYSENILEKFYSQQNYSKTRDNFVIFILFHFFFFETKKMLFSRKYVISFGKMRLMRIENENKTKSAESEKFYCVESHNSEERRHFPPWK